MVAPAVDRSAIGEREARNKPTGRSAIRRHIVDVLIAERAPRLTHSWIWPVARPALYKLLDYDRARRMADAIRERPGRDTLDYVSDLLELQVSARGLERMPRTGRLVVICNHPTGIADGLAVYQALKQVRDDLIFYANADALRVAPRLDEVIIPVEWVEAKRTREKTRVTLVETRAAFEAGRALVVFPAGRIARKDEQGRLTDPTWMPTALSLARKHGAPVLPVHVTGPWSTLFHFFNRFSPELRDITLFHELLNKRGGRFGVSVGALIPSDAFQGDDVAATTALKHYIERVLSADPDAPFNPAWRPEP